MNPDDGPRKLLSRGFWIALAFALACVLAALIVVLVASRSRAHEGAHAGSGRPPFTAAGFEGSLTTGKSKAGVDERPWNG